MTEQEGMICPYKQTIAHFGPIAQLRKLREECLELVEAIDIAEEMGRLGLVTLNRNCMVNVYDEAGDVLNVLRSLMTKTPAIEQMAATKIFRTQVRIRTGYYEINGSEK